MDFLRFNRLYIVESLEDHELKTGTELFEYLQPVVEDSPFALSLGLFTCAGVQGFRDVAARVLEKSKAGHLPWLHIECHGSSDDGLYFANGSELSWEDLCDLLRPINEACGFQLFVVVSTCYGANIVSGIDTGEGAPCLGLIGPSDQVDPAELLGHFRDFYRTLLQTTDIGHAMGSWKNRKLQHGSMAIVTANDWWRDLMFSYLSENGTSKGIEAVARRQRKLLHAEGKNQSVGSLKRIFRRQLPAIVEIRFRRYFMLDEVPQNTQRFALQLAEVKNEVRKNLSR